MTSPPTALAGPPLADSLKFLESQAPRLGRRELREALAPMIARLQAPLPAEEALGAIDAALAMCRRMYASARSGDILPLGRATLMQAGLVGNPALVRRASTACGVLSADTADVAGGLEYHIRSLRLATAERNPAEVGAVWSNIGLTVAITGNDEMAARSYYRALGAMEAIAVPVFSRFTSCCNLSNSLFHMGEIDEGLRFGCRALDELTPSFVSQDPHGAILLRRNLARLLIAAGRVEEARVHVEEAARLAGAAGSPRALIAAATTRAAYELAVGSVDVALTRLDQTLTQARQVPATLRDTLVCVIQAEEASGSVERALLRLNELSDHVYGFAVDRARQHVELSGLGDGAFPAEARRQEQHKARLVSLLHPPDVPQAWDTLRRLAVGAALRMDKTGWHGVRVGALTRALALAHGESPIRALEIGLAAELHDIGMLSVPEGILKRRKALNDVERRLYLRHTEAGAEILRDDQHPRILLAREIARYHHAWWDGNGHPERVGGRFIPLPARLCAVADAYDEAVCGHGGRDPMSMGDALELLRRGSGTQFDPELVARFDALVRSETENLGIDPAEGTGLEGCQELILSLQEERGFL